MAVPVTSRDGDRPSFCACSTGVPTGVPSSRQIEKRTYIDIAFRVIAVNRHLDQDSFCEFMKRHLRSLAGLFVRNDGP